MYKNIIGLLMILCVSFHKALLLTVTLETSPPVFNESIELRCNGVGSTCCSTYTRTWSRDGSVILSGTSTAKYTDKKNDSGQYFSLIINKLDFSDLNHAYSCEYGFANTPSPLSLTQTDSYIHLPTDPECILTVEDGKITGTVTVKKAAPAPNASASFGGKDLTSALTVTSTKFDTWFYKATVYIYAEIDTKALCCNSCDKRQFNMSIWTSTRSTPVCGQDFCNCGYCIARNCAWSMLIPVCVSIVNLIIVLAFFSKALVTNKQKILVLLVPFSISAVFTAVIAIPTGYLRCHCIDFTDPAFIALGAITFTITSVILFYNILDRDDILPVLILKGLITLGLFLLYLLYKKLDEDPAGQKEHGKNASSEGKKDKQ